MGTISYRIAASLVGLGLLLATACAPSAAPSPTVAPPAPTKAAAPATTPQASAATTAAPSAGAGADWQAQWDKVLAAAKQEGTVVVSGSTGTLYRDAATAFEQAYPGIKVQFTGIKGSDLTPKIEAERQGGQYLWDVYTGGWTTINQDFLPNGIVDPLKPALILPEVTDTSKWLNGMQGAWMDPDGKYAFGFGAYTEPTIYVNRSLVPESQLNNHDQLLDPQWKGKIVSADPRKAGAQNEGSSWLLKLKGQDWLTKFYGQLTMVSDERSAIEALVRGNYPLMMDVSPPSYEEFVQQGLTKDVQGLNPESPEGSLLVSGALNVALFNKAPHPNAAIVYINWLLSKQGQDAFVKATNVSSRRLDAIPGDPFYTPKPGVQYGDAGISSMPYKEKAITIAKQVFK